MFSIIMHVSLLFQLISNALDAMVNEENFNPDMSLLQCIAALHVLFHKYRSQILWFGQLVGHSPEVMISLYTDSIRCKQEMVNYTVDPHAHILTLAIQLP